MTVPLVVAKNTSGVKMETVPCSQHETRWGSFTWHYEEFYVFILGRDSNNFIMGLDNLNKNGFRIVTARNIYRRYL